MWFLSLFLFLGTRTIYCDVISIFFLLFYRWYASILECTGAAIASASAATNGIDQQDTYMRTALHYAAEQGHEGIVHLLLKAGKINFIL